MQQEGEKRIPERRICDRKVISHLPSGPQFHLSRGGRGDTGGFRRHREAVELSTEHSSENSMVKGKGEDGSRLKICKLWED